MITGRLIGKSTIATIKRESKEQNLIVILFYIRIIETYDFCFHVIYTDIEYE
jgi:hypothetical protein